MTHQRCHIQSAARDRLLHLNTNTFVPLAWPRIIDRLDLSSGPDREADARLVAVGGQVTQKDESTRE